MRRALSLSCVGVAGLGAASVTLAQPGNGIPVTPPSAFVIADGVRFDIPVEPIPGSGMWRFIPGLIDQSGFKISWTAGLIDPDPQINYGITVTDFGAPSAFMFMFSSPIVLGPGPRTVSESVVGGLTDASGDGVSITPTDASAKLQISTLDPGAVNMGVNVGNGQTHPAGTPGSLFGYGPYSTGTLPGPAGAFTTLSVQTSFTLSGNDDIAVLTGSAVILEIPGPGAASLAALGSLTLLRRAPRRRD